MPRTFRDHEISDRRRVHRASEPSLPWAFAVAMIVLAVTLYVAWVSVP